MPDETRTPILPAHIETTVQAIARLHAQHREQATVFQRFINAVTAKAGRPSFVAYLTIGVVGWIMFNLILTALGHKPLDEPPFYWLQGVVGLGALYMTSLILATQRHDDVLASHREQLTLELAILNEQKAAKIIELLEELRRDDPHIRNRFDPEAAAMATAADPQAVFDAIKDSHDEMLIAAGNEDLPASVEPAHSP